MRRTVSDTCCVCFNLSAVWSIQCQTSGSS